MKTAHLSRSVVQRPVSGARPAAAMLRTPRAARPLIWILLAALLGAGALAVEESDWMLQRQASRAADAELGEMAARMPGSAIVQYELGRRLAASGQPARAVDALEHAEADDPNSARTGALLGDQLTRLARFHEAAAVLQSAERKHPADPDIAYSLGLYYYRVFADQEAVQTLQQAVKLAKSDVRAWRLLGEAQLAINRNPEAVRSYTEALRIAPGDADTLAHRATARRMMDDLPGAEADLRAALKSAPARPDLQYMLAEMLERYEQAPANLPEAQRLLAGLVASRAPVPEAQRELARVAIARRDWSTAVRALQPYMRDRPNDAEALYLYARALQGLGRPAGDALARYAAVKREEDTRKDLLLRVQNDPNDLEARRASARYLTAHAETAFAILEWERIQHARPNDAEAAKELDALRPGYNIGGQGR